MAYESSIPFADIRDFREAEINGISALFTMCRLVPLALANFTGTFVSRQPLLREGQAYAEIRRYGIYDATTVDEWSENNNDNS